MMILIANPHTMSDTCESVGAPPKTTPHWKFPSNKRLSYVEMWRRSYEEVFKTSADLPAQWHKGANSEVLEVESAAAAAAKQGWNISTFRLTALRWAGLRCAVGFIH